MTTATMLTVIGQRLLIRRDTAPTKSEGGIHLPEQVREKLSEGNVITAGAKCEHEFTEGQRVVFNPYSGDTVKIDGEDLLVVREDDILLAF